MVDGSEIAEWMAFEAIGQSLPDRRADYHDAHQTVTMLNIHSREPNTEPFKLEDHRMFKDLAPQREASTVGMEFCPEARQGSNVDIRMWMWQRRQHNKIAREAKQAEKAAAKAMNPDASAPPPAQRSQRARRRPV